MNAVVPIMQHAAQAAGKVLKPGQVSVRFDLGGDKRLHHRVNKEMVAELRGMLELANFGGTYPLIVLASIKGSSATKGLRIGAPHKNGTMLTAQYGDNGSRIQCLLCCPRFEDPIKFTQALQRVQRGLDEANDEEKGESKTPASPEALAVSSITSSPKEVAAELATSEEDPQFTDYQDFTKDPDNVALLILHLRDKAENGLIPKETVTRVLVETWKFDPRRAGPIHRHLRARGLVVETDEVFYKLKSEAPVQAPLTGYASKIADLEKLASPLAEIKSQRQEIAKKMAELQAQMKPIADQLSELARQDAELEANLKKGDPKALEAAEKLAKIQELIGG